jgi:putative endopeptidase
MDSGANPRQDFYKYADGAWLAANPVPEDKTRWSAFDELYERNLNLLKEILEEAAENVSDQPKSSPRRIVGEFYRSAMDTKRIEELGFKPIMGLLELADNVELGEDLSRCIGELRNAGIDSFFTSYSAADKKSSAIYAFYFDQGGLSLPDREYYIADSFASVRAEFRLHVVRMFELLTGEDCSELADRVIRLETDLAKKSRARVDLRDDEKNYNLYSIRDLEEKFPSLHFPVFLETSGVSKAASNVIIGQPEFFELLERILSDENSLKDIRTFLKWRVIHSAAQFLHSPVEREDFDFFRKKLLGQKEPEPRWKRAVHVIDGLLGEALGALYVEKHFPPEAERRAALMIEDLQAVFRERLANLPWMTEATRKQALLKFERFGVKIGYPKHFRDYSSIAIDEGDYAGNAMRAAGFESKREAKRVGEKVDKEEWLMTPPTVDAYFHPMENTINFPAGILQPPFFDATLDDAVNYGAIGAIIGHEITHGYDDQGRRYDAEGNLRDWWTPEDEKEFRKRAKGIEELYGAQEPLPGERVNGELTLGENIADFGGVSLAYEALKRRLGNEKHERKENLTPEQRFFVSWAQIWRENIREEELRRHLTIDTHSPLKYRATLPVINHPGFVLAFPTLEEAMDASYSEMIGVW